MDAWIWLAVVLAVLVAPGWAGAMVYQVIYWSMMARINAVLEHQRQLGVDPKEMLRESFKEKFDGK